MRAFFAIWPSGEVRAALAEVIRRISKPRDGVAWIPEDNLHVTVKFLGEVDVARAEELCDVLAITLSEIRPFTATLGRGGVFPDLRRPRVLFAGLSEGAERVTEAAARVEKCAEERGFPREDRPFHPHVTVGRVKNDRAARDAVTQLALAKIPEISFPVRSVTLVESELSSAGSRYTIVREAPLGSEEVEAD